MIRSTPFLSQYNDIARAIALVETHGQDVREIFPSIQSQLQDPDLRREFFRLLDSPVWIEPLKRAGFFSCPQLLVDEGSGIRHPHWPPSEYLARIARAAPTDIAKTLALIETNNLSILRDIVTAANNMPIEIAATVLPMVCKAVRADQIGTIRPQATELCAAFATNGIENAAMMLADAMFDLQRTPGDLSGGSRHRYWYEEGLRKIVPLLTERQAEPFITRLCNWLGEAIEQDERHWGSPSRAVNSWLWRPAIEEHEQNRDYDFPSAMVGFVRQAFEQAIGDGHMTLESGLAIVATQPASVFRRLRIHLLNHFAERACDLVRMEVLSDRTMLDTPEYRHEYAMLVGKRFSMLSQEERARWLAWIEVDHNINLNDANHEPAGPNTESSDSHQSARVRRWQLTRLHWIRSHLVGSQMDLYQELLAQFGEPHHAEFNTYHQPARWGFDSPLTIEELNSRPFAENIERIDAWEPPGMQTFPYDPQKEGLAVTFGHYVAGDVCKLSAQADLLKDRQPIYVRTFIERITDAAKTESIDIGAVLTLCAWVVDQPTSRDPAIIEQSRDMADPDWQYTRDSICRFLRAICDRAAREGSSSSLLTFREDISALLNSLLRDPPAFDVFDETLRSNLQVHDFLTAALNSPRGKALDALIAYARWIAKIQQRVELGRTYVPNGFGDMAEVQANLDWQIAGNNATFDSHAIIGTYLGLLHWIDQAWVEEKCRAIFDLAVIDRDPRRAYGWAAWNALLVWGDTSPAIYRMLRSQFRFAVQRLPKATIPPNAGKTPLHHFGDQLVLLYGRGTLLEFDEESLLFEFLKSANSDVRSQSIAFVGHILNDNTQLSEDVLARFRNLWDWYWPRFGRTDTNARPQSGLFPLWFASSHLAAEWTLPRLAQYLEIVPIPECDERVLGRLTTLADTHIESVTRLLDQMIRADDEGWRIHAWSNAAMEILKVALLSNETAEGMAVRLIDDLARHGHLAFSRLLEPNLGRAR